MKTTAINQDQITSSFQSFAGRLGKHQIEIGIALTTTLVVAAIFASIFTAGMTSIIYGTVLGGAALTTGLITVIKYYYSTKREAPQMGSSEKTDQPPPAPIPEQPKKPQQIEDPRFESGNGIVLDHAVQPPMKKVDWQIPNPSLDLYFLRKQKPKPNAIEESSPWKRVFHLPTISTNGQPEELD